MSHDAAAGLYRDIDACVRDLREDMVAFTSELVAIGSETRQDKEFVHTDRIVECAAIYARTAATILGRQSAGRRRR